MSLRRSAISKGPKSWTVADFGTFYREHRSELHAHANRLLRDKNRAEEVVQDALIKVMLAAPELDSLDHARGYLHRTIENLCIDIFRLEGRRPHLVALDEVSSEAEANWQVSQDHADVVAAADDAAIVRQALSMLSPAERAAIVMWEMEGRSTQEIATELGIKESSVRHTVSRARASLRKVLSTIIIDQERGYTALDLLSTTYRKSAEVAQKSGRAAMSFVLLVTAFLGFNSLTGSEPLQTTLNTQTISQVLIQEPAPEVDKAMSSNSPTGDANSSRIKSRQAEDLAELEILNAQLETAAAMVETLMLIEDSRGSN